MCHSPPAPPVGPTAGPQRGRRRPIENAGRRLCAHMYVKRSARTRELVPPVVRTVTSTSPRACFGASTTIRVADATLTHRASVRPNRTTAPLANPDPVTTTFVPPAFEPDFTDNDRTFGRARYRNRSGLPFALVPPAVVTVTSTTPAAAPAGAVAEM